MKTVPTIREIAQVAGVSLGTVSQALRGTGKTSRKTCARIRRIADEMGYLPNPLLSTLAARRFRDTARQHLIPVVFASIASREYSHSKLRYRDELKNSLQKLGYAFRFERIANAADLVKASRRWYQQGVQGVIMSGIDNSQWLKEAHLAPFSLVKVGARIYNPIVHTVMADAVRGMELALTKALEAGAKRIGFVIHKHQEPVRDDILRTGLIAVYQTQEWRDSLVDPFYTYFDHIISPKYQPAFDNWLKTKAPDLIIGHDLALEFLQQSTVKRAAKIPFYGLSHQDNLDVPTVTEPVQEIAARAVEWLDSQIRRRECGIPDNPVCILVQPYWDPGS